MRLPKDLQIFWVVVVAVIFWVIVWQHDAVVKYADAAVAMFRRLVY
jgi:hypothetical protein